MWTNSKLSGCLNGLTFFFHFCLTGVPAVKNLPSSHYILRDVCTLVRETQLRQLWSDHLWWGTSTQEHQHQNIIGMSHSGGMIIDYNQHLLGCFFCNDLSIMKLVINNNLKKWHLETKTKTKWPASSFLLWNLAPKTLQNKVRVFKTLEKLNGPKNHRLVFRYHPKCCTLELYVGADWKCHHL